MLSQHGMVWGYKWIAVAASYVTVWCLVVPGSPHRGKMNTLASSFVGLRLGSSSFNGATSRLQGKSSSTSGPTVLPVTSKCSDVLLSPAALHSQPERNKSVREYGSMTGPASGFVCRERACGISVSGAYLGAVSLGRGLRRRLAQLQFVRVAQATKSVYCVGTSVVGKLSSFLVE